MKKLEKSVFIYLKCIPETEIKIRIGKEQEIGLFMIVDFRLLFESISN